LRAVSHRRGRQRQKGHDAAFAAITRAEDKRHVLERNDDHERPKYRRYASEYVLGGERNPVLGIEGFFRGVERARPDVAVNDTQREQRKTPCCLPRGMPGGIDRARCGGGFDRTHCAKGMEPLGTPRCRSDEFYSIPPLSPSGTLAPHFPH